MLKRFAWDPIPIEKPSTTPTKKHHRDNGLHRGGIENSHNNYHKKRHKVLHLN